MELQDPSDIQKWAIPSGFGVTEGRTQLLKITARNNSIEKLTAQLWLSKQGPTYLIWRSPTEEIEPPLSILRPGGKQEVIPGKITLKLHSEKIDLIKDDIAYLAVWFAWKEQNLLRFNTPTREALKLKEWDDPRFYFEIRFIAEQEIANNRVRRYILTFDSYENIKLVEVKDDP